MDAPTVILIICIVLILAIRNAPAYFEMLDRRRSRKRYMEYRSRFPTDEEKKAKEEYDRQRRKMVKM